MGWSAWWGKKKKRIKEFLGTGEGEERREIENDYELQTIFSIFHPSSNSFDRLFHSIPSSSFNRPSWLTQISASTRFFAPSVGSSFAYFFTAFRPSSSSKWPTSHLYRTSIHHFSLQIAIATPSHHLLAAIRGCVFVYGNQVFRFVSCAPFSLNFSFSSLHQLARCSFIRFDLI